MSNSCRPPRFRCIPGLRFHPTDIELTLYHLKRKFRGKQSQFIADVDIYKHAPWELPAKSCSITKDLAWYFFCLRERKYPNGNRTKRTTGSGFWKTTGNDRNIRHEGNIVGKIKTLIFHTHGGENGVRTNWVMHEYRLIDQDTYVICKVFEKSGVGPKNGAQYGAPFDEAEWNDDEGLDGVVSFPLACVSGPAASLQNIQEKSMMTSTFTPANMCIGSSSEPISFNSVPPTENISTPDFCVVFKKGGWNDDEEFDSVVSSHLACVSGPAASLQNIQEKSMMTSTFTPFDSVPPTENISTPDFCVVFTKGGWNDDEEFDSVVSSPLACVSGPAASLQNIQEKSMMTSTFTPANMCIGSSSEPISFNSVPPTENISTPDFCVVFKKGGWNDDDEFDSVVSSHLACVSGPAASLQNIQEKSMMTSTFTPTNMCISSSAQPAENKSTRVFGDDVSFELPGGPGLSLDDLVKPPGAFAHDNYGIESMNEVYQGFFNYQSYSGNKFLEDGMDLSDLLFEEETQNMAAEDVQTYANPQELGTLCKKRKYAECIEDNLERAP